MGGGSGPELRHAWNDSLRLPSAGSKQLHVFLAGVLLRIVGVAHSLLSLETLAFAIDLSKEEKSLLDQHVVTSERTVRHWERKVPRVGSPFSGKQVSETAAPLGHQFLSPLFLGPPLLFGSELRNFIFK